MIEQRTMFVVEATHNVEEVLALYDTEKEEVISYRIGSDWFGRFEDERYFATKQQADCYVAGRQAQLRARFPEVRAFIEEVQKTDKEVFPHEDEEYMGKFTPGKRTSWFLDYRKEQNKAQRYLELIKTGFLNISGFSFRLEDVDYIKWCKDENATIFLKNENGIRTSDDLEYEIIDELFGGNRSGKEIER